MARCPNPAICRENSPIRPCFSTIIAAAARCSRRTGRAWPCRARGCSSGSRWRVLMALRAEGCDMRNEINRNMTGKSRTRRIVGAGTTILLCFAVGKSPIAENLLRNSSFELATNQTTPDYWDLHHVAALRFRDLYAQYNLVDDPSAPIVGVRVLRITNSESGFPYLYLLSKR